MAIKLDEKNDGQILEVHVTGKLIHEDYQHFGPEFDRLAELHGKIRILFEMVDFHGWNAAALWDDIKLDIKRHADIEKLAMVGDRKWEEGMSAFCKPVTNAKIRYFDHEAIEAARTWLEGG